METGRSMPCNGARLDEIKTSETKPNDNKVSQIKIIASQLVFLLPVILLEFRLGMGLGFTIVLIPEIFKKNSEINATLDILTWFSSYYFVSPIANISAGFLAQKIGVRRLMMCFYLFFILADLIFHWANDIVMVSIAQVIVGFSNGICKGPCTTYVAEIMHPKFRSITMASVTLSVSAGMLLATLLGNFIHWRTQTFASMIFPTIGFVLIHFIPDSPQWLASKNRLDDAEKSLARLRWWTTPEAVKAELYSCIKETPISLPLSEITPEKDSNSRKQTKLKKALALYLDRSFYVPFLTVICMFFFGVYNGAYSLPHFAVLIFPEFHSPINGPVVSAILSGSLFAGAFIHICTVRFLGKRFLALASSFIIIVCLILAVIFIYLMDDNQSTLQTYSWVVSIALIISSFAQQTGIGKMMYILNSELYPQKLRYVGGGIGFFIYDIMSTILSKIFLHIVKAITLANTLILFAIINIVGFVVIYFILPETEGVSLQDIEAHYAGTRNLKNKVKN